MAADHTAHRHGGDPAADFQRLGLAPGPVLDFSVNINPLGPPPEITAAWNGWRDDIHRYPTPDGRGVTRYYEERFGLAPASVAAGNGSTELIYLVPRALGLKTAAVATPAFHDYRRSILVNGGKVVEFPAMAGTEEEWERKVVELLPRAQALWVGNPNNPTGQLIEAERLLNLAERFPEKWFLVDEAFIQFVAQPENHSLLHPSRLRKNIVVFHSLTKFYALAGLRIGAAIGHPHTMAAIRRHKEPWSVSLPAERAAEGLAAVADYELHSRRLMAEERKVMTAFVRESPLMEALAPTANFILARWRVTPDLDDLLRGMLRRGIHLRDARNFSGLADNWFRFAILGTGENKRLRRAFGELAEETL